MAAPNKFAKTLGRRIDSLREQRGMSFQQMASACDMDKAQVYKICTAGVDVRASSLVKIAKGLNVNIQELFDF